MAIAIVLSGLVRTAAPPASADGNTLICESHGNYCVGAANLNP